MIRLAAVAFLLLFARPAAAGPFGLERGMTLQQFGKAERIGPGMYQVTEVPNAIDGEQGFLTVEYALSNEDACEAEIAKAEDSSL
jgi:hypothetical protein